MDYQIVPRTSCQYYMFVSIFVILQLLPYCLCIVNRDLVLTPKQGLQLSGKRIFYEESNNNEVSHYKNGSLVDNAETRPWERTLKHVTYLTLFTNAANGIITGNFSKVKEYNDFLNSPYVRSSKPIDSRFGDIVLLAQGRLESMANGSYRFMEDNCNYECARESNIVAVWHVQKIRHRDTADSKYHYEMKFSVSPVTTKTPTETIVRGGPNKRTIMDEQKSNVQTFIQKEDDYPQSFEKIISAKENDFLKRRYDAARNFRQVNHRLPVQQQQVTPMPQSTFLRGVYRHPPAPLKSQLQQPPSYSPQVYNIQPNLHQHQIPFTERLNTGEYYKGNYVPKASQKLELFPSLLNMFMGKPQQSLAPPTTFRAPTSPMKFPRPDIYALHQHSSQEFQKFHDYHHPFPQEHFSQTVTTAAPLVTHHYHHHYFMPNNTAVSLEQIVQHSNAEHKPEQHTEIYHNEVAEELTPDTYITNKYDEPLTTTFRYQHIPEQQFQNQQQTQPPSQRQHQSHYQANFQQPNFYQNSYQQYQNMPPAPQKFVFHNTQIEQQQVLHVTTAPPLKKPQYQQHHQQYERQPYTTALEYTTVNIPLLISYPSTVNEEDRADVPTPRNKPFIQSEPIDETIRYSEPDPLYANVNNNEKENIHFTKYITNEDRQTDRISQQTQLETPEQPPNQTRPNTQPDNRETDSKKEHSESIEAQLPAPNKTQLTRIQSQQDKVSQDVIDYEDAAHIETTSQSTTTTKISEENTTTNSENLAITNTVVSETTRPKIFPTRKKRIGLKTGTTTSTTVKSILLPTTTTENIKFSTTSKPRKHFVSTSSTESPLRSISRYRNSFTRTSSSTTTTTEKPVLKWTPKRKAYIAKSLTRKSTTQAQHIEDTNENENDENNDNDDIKANESNNIRNTKLGMILTTTEIPETTTKSSNDITITGSSTTSSFLLTQTSPFTTQSETEIYEVLTQKSVSKSVSLKVGPNGEEIPVIIDDEENEVKAL